MSEATKHDFLKCLKKSGIATDELIALWTASISDDASARTTANSLVESGHLTRWQAKHLMSGRTNLKFENYVLLERIKRNEIGDTFVAMQTKLDRKVKILFLSKTLSARLSERERESLLRQIAATTEIDHPSLEHLHVIELESERFLIVTDYVDALTLNNPELLSQLQPDDLTTILVQAMEATAFAHEYGLSHGAMTENDLVFDPAGKLTVQNMAASCLVQNLALQHSDPVSKIEEDVTAIQRIGKRLLNRLGQHETEKSEIYGVGQVLEQISNRTLGLKEAAVAIKNLGNDSKDAAATDARQPTPSIKGDQEPNAPIKNNIHTGRKGHLSKALLIRRVLHGSAAVLALGLIYYLGVSVGWFGGNNSRSMNQSARRSEEKPELPTLDAELVSTRKEPVTELASGERAQQPTERLSNTSIDQTVSGKDASGGEGGSETENSVQNSDDNVKPSVNVTTTDAKLPNEHESGDTILKAFKSLSSDTVPDKPKQKSSDKIQAELNVAQASIAETNSSAAGTSDIPPFIDLPPTSSFEAANVCLAPANSFSLDLISDEHVSKSKISFELSGRPNEVWQVNVTGKSPSPGNPIAEFRNINEQLQFVWLKPANTIKDAAYLCNCVLKVTTSTSSSYVNLRKPIPITGFVLKREDPQLKVDLPALNYLPALPVAELNELKEETYGPIFLQDGKEDLKFSRKAPLAVHFRDLSEYQMIFLLLSSNLRNKSQLEAELLVQLDPSQKPRIATAKTMDAAKIFLEEQIAKMNANMVILKKPINEIRRYFNLSPSEYKDSHRDAQVKELKKEIEISENRFKAFREIQTQIEPFYDQPLPVTIYFEVVGQRVVLATSVIE